MLRILAITLLALGGLSAAHADVYRWVDSKGVVQYSDVWVPGSVLVKTDKNRASASAPAADPAPAANAPAPPASSASRAEEILARERDQRAVAADVSKTRDEQCKKISEAYEKAVSRVRMYKPETEGGEKVYLSDAEINEYRLQLLNQRRQVCGS
jgi:hypothetical protein